MNISFPLAHIAGSRVDAEVTIIANALNARADKEIVLQGTIDSISCRSDGEFIDAPVPFTVQYVEIAAVIPAYIIRVYDNEHHVLLKDLQDGRLTTGSEEHLVRLLAERAGETYLQWADDPRKHHYYRGLPYKDTYRVLDGKLSQACLARYGKPLQRTLRANTGLRRQVVTCLLTIHNLMSGTKSDLEKQHYFLSMVRIYQDKAQVIPYGSRAYNNPQAGSIDIDYALIHTLPILKYSAPVDPNERGTVSIVHKYKALGYSKADIAFILGLDETSVENALKEKPRY